MENPFQNYEITKAETILAGDIAAVITAHRIRQAKQEIENRAKKNILAGRDHIAKKAQDQMQASGQIEAFNQGLYTFEYVHDSNELAALFDEFWFVDGKSQELEFTAKAIVRGLNALTHEIIDEVDADVVRQIVVTEKFEESYEYPNITIIRIQATVDSELT